MKGGKRFASDKVGEKVLSDIWACPNPGEVGFDFFFMVFFSVFYFDISVFLGISFILILIEFVLVQEVFPNIVNLHEGMHAFAFKAIFCERNMEVMFM